jgi:predicted glycoside hydrolase/deacetylase ChbG (UPF0249 family)
MLESSEKAALAEEMRVQIRKCRAQNMPLTHIDSHHHIHTAWAVASVLIRIAKEEGIHFIRIARNLGPDSNVFKTIYKHVFNDKLKMLNLAHTDYFGSIDDLLLLKKQDGIPDILHSCEIMIHPTFNNENALVDKHSIIIKRTLEDLIAEINDFKSIVSFNGSKYQR